MLTQCVCCQVRTCGLMHQAEQQDRCEREMRNIYGEAEATGGNRSNEQFVF